MSDRKACAALGLNGTGALYKLQEEDSALAARFAHARRAGAAAMASECLDIADDLVEHETADPVRVANARIAQRQWLAARRNREEFGDSAKVAVQINVADMHLTALRAGTALASPVVEGEARELPPASEDVEPEFALSVVRRELVVAHAVSESVAAQRFGMNRERSGHFLKREQFVGHRT